MRATIIIGLILVALGATALYQTRNSFFMYVVGHATYFPADEDAALVAQFDELGEERTSIGIVPLRVVVDAQVRCVREVSGKALTPLVEAAFRRFGLVLLGAGKNSFSPVIPPNARKIPELRRDLTMPDREYRPTLLAEAEANQLDELIDELTRPDHKIYQGINLSTNFAHLELRQQVTAVLNSGQGFHTCVGSR